MKTILMIIYRPVLLLIVGKGKGRICPRTGLEGLKGVEYSSTLSLISALNRVSWSVPQPVLLYPEKTRFTMYRALNGARGHSIRMRKISLPLGFDPRTVKPVTNFV
jgi:hypothetical protein